ncbi:MAG: MBL fold metallo-hydrolase RNA specificity domain-containing protein [Roseburia sp.]
MILEFLGAAHEVTGSCHYLSFHDKHLLVDCGMEQGPNLYVNQDIPVNAAEIDYVFITHAHIDHSGMLPLLHKHGFRGQVFATTATAQLCNIMLKDSAHIQMFEAEWRNRKARRAGKEEVVPIYDMDDAIGVLEHFVSCDYHNTIEVCEGLRVRFVDAGHLLGSASIEMWIEEKTDEGIESRKLVFSGDLGPGNRPLIRDPEYIKDADYVLVESTYGDRLHTTMPDFAKELARVLRDTFIRGGNLVIPAFSVGRTQEMLYFLRRVKTEELLPEFEDFEVYVDSPLAVEATTIFNENVSDCFDKDALDLIGQGINPIRFPGLRMAITSDESKMINFNEKSKVIISASGMCEAGRIRHHLKHNLWRADSTILFVGYQVPGTLGNSLLNGAKEVRLFGETIDVRAKIENLPGISGHADQSQLTAWVKAFEKKPKKIFVVHGEDKVTETFAKHLEQETGVCAYAPYSGDAFNLLTGECIREGSRAVVERKEKSVRAASNVFARLLAAGGRLMTVIQKCEGLPNKELAKFADQINALCGKWDR